MAAETDAELVRRLVAETRASQALPAPGWNDWLREVALAFARWMSDVLDPVARRLGTRVDWLEYAAATFVIVTLALLVYFSGRTLVLAALRRTRGRAPAVGAPGAPARTAARDAAAFREEVEALLARGDVAGALAALWWWLASTLLARAVDPSWTSRELLERAGRRDLLPLALSLDRQAYGPVPPPVAEVRHLAARFEEALR